MVTASFINRLLHAIDQIEKRSQPARPFKVVTVRRGYKEDPDGARIPLSLPRASATMRACEWLASRKGEGLRNVPRRASEHYKAVLQKQIKRERISQSFQRLSGERAVRHRARRSKVG